jgi:decaprenylphospho-beta-D-ribofuranose 2-oxidase
MAPAMTTVRETRETPESTVSESSVRGIRPLSQPATWRTPPIREQLIASYGGKSVRTHVATPATREELWGAFKYAAGKKLRVTFRGGGHAFDTQSLNERLVISMEKFKRIDVDTASRTVTAEAGAEWGDVLAKTAASGMVPYVMVTTHTATVGGTLSSDSLSRFSPTLGREGLHVERFSLMTPGGEILECSRDENASYFRTAIGGLGYVGAILDVTHRLLDLGFIAPNIAVETQFTKDVGLENIAVSLLAHLRKRASQKPFPGARKAVALARSNPTENAWAVSAVVYLTKSDSPTKGEKGLIATSRYVEKAPNELRRSIFHDPTSPLAWALQIAAMVPFLRSLGYWLVFLQSYARPYVDALAGYTFFEDGNRNLRDVGRAIGLPMGIHQHTFIVPFDPSRELDPPEADFGSSKLATFFGVARTLLKDARISPTLIDVLFLPDDGGSSFALSSSRDMPGFAVTFTFEKALSTSFEAEKKVLQKLAIECESLDGRVHLVKNVDVDSAHVAREYGEGLADMQRARLAINATTTVGNEFLGRVLGLDKE